MRVSTEESQARLPRIVNLHSSSFHELFYQSLYIPLHIEKKPKDLILSFDEFFLQGYSGQTGKL